MPDAFAGARQDGQLSESERAKRNLTNHTKRDEDRWMPGPTIHAESELAAIYHRRPMACCILPGDTDGGGLAIVRPLAGLIMGMALRARVAAGW